MINADILTQWFRFPGCPRELTRPISISDRYLFNQKTYSLLFFNYHCTCREHRINSIESKNMSQEQTDSSDSKFMYLKGRFVLRFPFTFTAIKWGVALGTFFSLHSYVKTRQATRAAQWFFWGTILSTFPIWCFFMVKYSFYSHSIRKFEADQIETIRQTELLKSYLNSKVKSREPIEDEEQLIRAMQQKQREDYSRNSQLDFLLLDVTSTSYDS